MVGGLIKKYSDQRCDQINTSWRKGQKKTGMSCLIPVNIDGA